jgi:hypothetical protein
MTSAEARHGVSREGAVEILGVAAGSDCGNRGYVLVGGAERENQSPLPLFLGCEDMAG